MDKLFFVFLFLSCFHLHAMCFTQGDAGCCASTKSCLLSYSATGLAGGGVSTGGSAAGIFGCSQASLEGIRLALGISSAAGCLCGMGTKAVASGVHSYRIKTLRNIVMANKTDNIFADFHSQVLARAQQEGKAMQLSPDTLYQLIQDANTYDILCSADTDDSSEEPGCCAAFASCLWNATKLLCVGDMRVFWSVDLLMSRILDGSLAQRIQRQSR